MQTRDMTDGFSECFRSFRDVCRAIPDAAKTCRDFMKQTARAHYALAGQYTMPLEDNPPTPADLNTLGQIALTVPIPLTIVSILSSLTIFPLIGNSIQSLPRAFVDCTNLALLDSPEDQLKKTNIPGVTSEVDNRAWYRRYVYGAPGYWLGASLGIAAAGIILAGRVMKNSLITTTRITQSITNLTLPVENAFSSNLASDQRAGYLKYIFGAPGAALGLVTGTIAAMTVFMGRLITNTAKTSASMFKSTINHTLPTELQFKDNLLTTNDRPAHLKFGMGAAGLGLGFVAGGIAAAGVFLTRIFINTVKTSASMMKSLINYALPAPYFTKNLITDHDRPLHLKFGMGLPGLALGVVMGGIISVGIFLGRLFTNTVKTSVSLFKSIVNQVTPQEYFKTGLITDKDRPLHLKFGMGVLGLGFGLISGAIAATGVFLARVLANSFSSGLSAFKSAINFTLPDSLKFQSGLLTQPSENQVNRLKYGMGLPGIILGGAIGLIGGIGVFLGRIITNTFKTMISVCKSLMNLVLPEKDLFKSGLLTEKDRPAHLKFGMGVLGLGFGFIAGGIAATSIFLARVFSNTVKTSISLFKSIVNQVTPEKYFTTGLLTDKDRPAHLKFGMGILGLGFGSIIGGIAATGIFLGRVFTNTIKTSVSLFKSIVNQVTPEKYFTTGLLTDKDRPAHLKFGMGILGLGFGVVIGGMTAAGIFLGRVFTNTLKTTVSMFKSIVNKTLPQPYFTSGLLTDKDRPAHLKFGMGVLGLGFGAVIGGISAIGIVLSRIFTNSAKTAVSLFKSLTNFVLPSDYQFKTGLISEKDRPLHLKFGMGAPGLIFGFIAGSISAIGIFLGRIFTNSMKTAVSMFKSIVNQFTPEKYFTTGLLTDKDRPAHLKFGMGILGLGLGLVTGSIAAAGIFLGRIFTNTVKTSISMIKSMLNHVTPEKYFTTGLLTDKDRPAHLKFGMGILGLGFGFIAGTIATTGVILGRILTNTIKTSVSLFKSMVNHALPKPYFNSGLLTSEDRPKHLKFGMGILGLGLGFIAGTITTAGVFLTRIVTNTVKTTISMFKSIVNHALPGTYFTAGLLTEKDRPAHLKFGMGILGLGIGSVMGALAATGVFFTRMITNSVKSGISAFKSALNLVIPKDYQFKTGLLEQPEASRPAHIKFGLGLPGIIIGGTLGGIAAIGVILKSLVINTAKTTASMFKSVINPFLPNDNRFNDGLLTSKDRPAYLKFGVGALGLGLGLITGCVAAVGTFITRVITNTIKTSVSVFKSMTNEALAQPYFTTGLLSQPDRPAHLKFGMGVLGLGVGFIMGGIAATGIFLSRIFTNTIKTTISMFKSIINPVLPEGSEFKTGLISDNDRPKHLKFGMGILGVGIGLIAGSVAAAAVATVRCLNESRKSWQALSGSFVNGAVDAKRFDGLGGDTREPKKKALGFLGYVAATVTTLPVVAASYLVTKTLPIMAGLAFGIITAPLMALKKWANMCCFPRFGEATARFSVEQGFKNIYSSLKWNGRLNTGAVLPPDALGNKGAGAFTRKCFTFNVNTLTERTIDKLLQSSRAFNRSHEKTSEFFEKGNPQFVAAVEDLKDRYKTDCCNRPSELAAIIQQIDDVAEFVRNYIFGFVTQTNEQPAVVVATDFYTKRNTSWRATFWGGKTQPAAAKPSELLKTPPAQDLFCKSELGADPTYVEKEKKPDVPRLAAIELDVNQRPSSVPAPLPTIDTSLTYVNDPSIIRIKM